MRLAVPAAALAVALAISLVSCGAPADDGLTVYAAASVRDAFTELGAAYGAETGVPVTFSFEASSTLRTQIAQGAPADVFASADLANARALVDAGLTADDPRLFATNALVIVVPAANPAGIDSWEALARPGVRIVAAGEDVPITRYAVDLVGSLAALPDAPEGFADAYAANVASREDNVRAALAKVELGVGDAAIVYETDARDATGVTTIPVPDEADVRARYAVVVVTGARAGAGDFATWLLATPAQAILAEHGFGPPP